MTHSTHTGLCGPKAPAWRRAIFWLLAGVAVLAGAAYFAIALRAPASVARFGNVIVAEARDAQASRASFEIGTPRIYAAVPLFDVPPGSKLTAVWVTTSAQPAAAETVLSTDDITISNPVDRASFILARPQAGWPVGSYRVDLLLDGTKLASVPFKVE